MKELLEQLLESYRERLEYAILKEGKDNLYYIIGLCNSVRHAASNIEDFYKLKDYLRKNLPDKVHRPCDGGRIWEISDDNYSFPLTIKGHDMREAWMIEHINKH